MLENAFPEPNYRTTQYAGQLDRQLYEALDTALLNLGEAERTYALSNINSVKEFMDEYIEAMKVPKNGSARTLDEKRKVMRELVGAKQLKMALLTWLGSGSTPLDPEEYKKLVQLFKEEVFWKILTQKESVERETASQISKNAKFESESKPLPPTG